MTTHPSLTQILQPKKSSGNFRPDGTLIRSISTASKRLNSEALAITCCAGVHRLPARSWRLIRVRKARADILGDCLKRPDDASIAAMPASSAYHRHPAIGIVDSGPQDHYA
jgi:hypothetical protein